LSIRLSGNTFLSVSEKVLAKEGYFSNPRRIKIGKPMHSVLSGMTKLLAGSSYEMITFS
jgi:hypothetical protein